MQPQASAAQRAYSQRRSPGAADPGPPPSVRAISPGIPPGQAQRQSNVSVRSAPSSSGSRRANREGSSGSGSGSNMPLSQIEKSVTHLLVATKQLLETLTQWSRGQATDAQVSDVYVRLGYEFNMACRAFTAINVDTSDLGNVPDLLRSILEACLSQEASAESLEKYLPRIRDIIINLLHGLKRKQQRLRQKQGRDRESSVPERTTSVSTIASGSSGLTNMLEDTLESHRPSSHRPGSGPQPNGGSSPTRRFNAERDQSRGSVASEMSSVSSTTMQNMPVVPPYPAEESSMPSMPSVSPPGDLNIDSFPPPASYTAGQYLQRFSSAAKRWRFGKKSIPTILSIPDLETPWRVRERRPYASVANRDFAEQGKERGQRIAARCSVTRIRST
ncbi:uncharacterized protein TrAtP1_012642 [Trichoderma atroviride]|uniref:uncharacterized protein n=1 Tax=Hypocrea atroviridis TaxID=63577 RepID=UPI00331E2EE6|nr:hypothetical protein TrAtP1_012642 [Trichoderma atroviride]